MGTWLAFDDDAVGAIDETDIPKYFGESNSGSAYVLYYQAVDLKTAALGLQSTVVEAADQVLATPQPQPQPQEQAGSSPQAAPAVPPGLAEEGDSSDLSDLPYPVTPSASSSPQSEVQPRHVNGENATVKVTLPDEVAVSSASSSTLSAAVKGGIFKSLRRAPSVKVPTSIGLLADQLQSRGLHRNHTTIGSRKSVENVPPVPDLSLALDGLNGKDQEKGQPVSVERKVTWFNRRSGRSEKSRASMELPPTQALKSEPENESSSAATWFKNTGAGPKPKGNLKTARRPSEPNIFAPGGGTGLGFSTPSTSTSTNTSIHVEIPKRRRYDRADDDSHSARSAASSAVSTLALLGPDIGSTSSSRSPRHRPSQRSLSPPTPTFSRGERASSHERTMEKERHRPPMPMNSIEGLRSSSVRAMSPSDSIRKRASSPRMRSPAPLDLEAPPVPPKPSSMKHTNGVVKGGQDHRPSRRATATATATEANEYWHKRDKPPQESVGIGAFPIGDRNSSTTGSASNGIKRATRKLSLTTPMLHFGKRDKKERESERERDKEKIPTSSIGGIPTAVRT
jgi:ubiquitin carboxyl-terminal hydrolase 9/13